MKRIFIVLLVLLLCLALLQLNNNRPKVIIARMLNSAAPEGRAGYLVNLLGVIPVGEAVFYKEILQDYNENKVYHLSAGAENLKFYSGLFRGRASIDSYIDKNSLDPLLFRQRLSLSGKQEAQKEVFYDQTNHIMSIAADRRQILPHTQDPLSAVFNIRRMDFTKVKEFEMNINTNQKNYLLTGRARPAALFIRGQRVEIVMVEAHIARRGKNPYHKSSIYMALWKDKANLPVYIRVFSSGMLITARLISLQ